jgi:hypothetical protein
LKTDFALPYGLNFPGVFNDLDGYSKDLAHSWIDRHGTVPPFLKGIGDVTSYVRTFTARQFEMVHAATNILLRGIPDDIVMNGDDIAEVVDYKTARFTPGQDKLYHVYNIQLNVYRLIAESLGLPKVNKLWLIYTQPVVGPKTAEDEALQYDHGFLLKFATHYVEVPIDEQAVHDALAAVRALHDLQICPDALSHCRDCQRLFLSQSAQANLAYAREVFRQIRPM